MITAYDSLDISPEDKYFFLPHYFYSSLKDDVMTMEEHENVKKNYETMKLKDLGELNKIYNFQDTIILCKIFEQRSEYLQKLFKYNTRKCNFASSFSGCMHRDKNRCLTLTRLGFLKVLFLGGEGGGFNLNPLSYFKKNLSNFNKTLYNC